MDYQEEVRNDDELLIKLVRSYSNIFDKRHALFKNKNARAKAWMAIAATLHKKLDECEQRWVVLRHRYVTEKRKMRGDPGIKKSIWPLFNSMGFLDMFITPRKSSWNSRRADNLASEDSVESPSMSPRLATPICIDEDSNAPLNVKIQVEEMDIKCEEIDYEVLDSPSSVTSVQNSAENSSVDVTRKCEDKLTSSVRPGMSLLTEYIKRVDGQQPESRDSELAFSKTSVNSLIEVTRKCESKLTSSMGAGMVLLSEYIQKVEDRQKETYDCDFAFGKTVALHLKDIKNKKRKRAVKIQIMKILLGDESEDE